MKYEIQEQLIQEEFCKKEQILNYENGERYVSCYPLQHVMILENFKLDMCCALQGDLRGISPSVKYKNDWKTTINDFINRRDNLIDMIKNGEHTQCDGCIELTNAYWSRNRTVRTIALSPSFPFQLACSYCDVGSNVKNKENKAKYKKIEEELDEIEFIKVLDEMGLLDLAEPIQISSGEISLYKYKRKLLTYLSKYDLQIFTNAIIYDEQIASLAGRENSFLNISIDAGTKDTYKKVKGLDAWEVVRKNIKRYSDEKSNIELKYIILSNNCKKEDIQGFLDLCAELNLNIINISCDFKLDHSCIPEEMLRAAIEMARGFKKNNIEYRILNLWGEKNIRYIMDRI